jgi:hypothetical protein
VQAAVDVNVVVDVARDDAFERAQRALDRDCVAACWVTPGEARHQEPDAYDEALARLCRAFDALLPVSSLVPPTGVPGAYGRARRIVETATCRVVRLSPTTHRYALADWVLSPLPELCDREGVSILLDFAPSVVPWPAVVAFARAYPRLPMVVLDADLAHDRSLPAALDVAPNLICAVVDSPSSARLEHLCAVFGSHRFVSASAEGSGETFAEIARAPTLGDATRHAVLSGNAEALADGTYADTYLT